MRVYVRQIQMWQCLAKRNFINMWRRRYAALRRNELYVARLLKEDFTTTELMGNIFIEACCVNATIL